ncbi:hypothetical protein SPRG_07860 [Saprolegnia parasitica CBS 223.65]|uniref:Uncharacterized protein n=1 Tax=Saprolegnia parasitica (strain CBS 223.65) TaxID=695850 RepID=A0A067C9I5_SAPPC|nr:hypothetical protein SPRG_07860 [Saprolegnia parasitica CBS 223.65]KDO27153.1 hypothetical protein SPRG_07860 [Saprolegnia parasitica CBS 223.65]|eukprot:XP_012202241.1 hypothetical protein SPRG_07860 [Saprolegnia parasitica CBS 223.65]
MTEALEIDGQGRAIAELLRQCPNLRTLNINAPGDDDADDDSVELNDLLAVLADPVAHPRLQNMALHLDDAHATPRVGHVLAAWLRAAPIQSLHVSNVVRMDDSAAIAFCDALEASTTLQDLSILSVANLAGFHGRQLPASLLKLDFGTNAVLDDATIRHLATALGSTRLQRLACSDFPRLVQIPAAAPMFHQLHSLVVNELRDDQAEAFLAGLACVPALRYLAFWCSTPGTWDFAARLMDTLETTCRRLDHLRLEQVPMDRSAVAAVLAGVPRLPHLIWLNVAPNMFYVLTELVAAGRHVRELLVSLHIAHDDDKRAFLRALALVRDVPFVVCDLPDDVESDVADVLAPRPDRRDRCRLRLGCS